MLTVGCAVLVPFRQVVRGVLSRLGGESSATTVTSLVKLLTGHDVVATADYKPAYGKLYSGLESCLDVVDWQMTKEYFHHLVQVSPTCWCSRPVVCVLARQCGLPPGCRWPSPR